jgi:hypothetical protein
MTTSYNSGMIVVCETGCVCKDICLIEELAL